MPPRKNGQASMEPLGRLRVDTEQILFHGLIDGNDDPVPSRAREGSL